MDRIEANEIFGCGIYDEISIFGKGPNLFRDSKIDDMWFAARQQRDGI